MKPDSPLVFLAGSLDPIAVHIFGDGTTVTVRFGDVEILMDGEQAGELRYKLGIALGDVQPLLLSSVPDDPAGKHVRVMSGVPS